MFRAPFGAEVSVLFDPEVFLKNRADIIFKIAIAGLILTLFTLVIHLYQRRADLLLENAKLRFNLDRLDALNLDLEYEILQRPNTPCRHQNNKR